MCAIIKLKHYSLSELAHMYLKQLKLVTRAARPSLITSRTHPMSGVLLVNGAATDASASDNDTPTSAAFNAAQSLAPSPHMRTVYPISCSRSTTSFFSSGDMRAKIWHRASICVCRVSNDTQTGLNRESIRAAKSPAGHY
jgi:hypothetical protein